VTIPRLDPAFGRAFTADRLRQWNEAAELLVAEVLPLEDRARQQGRLPSGKELTPLCGRARDAGLWNLFLTNSPLGPGLTNLEYAAFAELMGHGLTAAEVFNCAAPDSGNMEILALFGSAPQQEQWLAPLLRGDIRSCFSMTEPGVAGSDPGNVATTVRPSRGGLVVNGRKWFSSGVLDPRCRVIVLFAVSDPDATPRQRHSIVLVPIDAPGVTIGRSSTVHGYESPGGHCEIAFDDVFLPADSVVGDLGAGHAIAQARLGPGRIHHAMRCIGMAEHGLGLLVQRARDRHAFGSALIDKGVVRTWIAESRLAIDQARLLVAEAALAVDERDRDRMRTLTSMIKVVAPRTATTVLDTAIQVFGAQGLTEDVPLARLWSLARSLRFGDGPDEVHLEVVARAETHRRERAR
jgi:acyl-CoA dehydrogenase